MELGLLKDSAVSQYTHVTLCTMLSGRGDRIPARACPSHPRGLGGEQRDNCRSESGRGAWASSGHRKDGMPGHRLAASQHAAGTLSCPSPAPHPECRTLLMTTVEALGPKNTVDRATSLQTSWTFQLIVQARRLMSGGKPVPAA